MIFTGIKNKKFSRIGLDIGSDSIKMLQLGEDDEKRFVVAADKTVIPQKVRGDENSVREFIISAVKRMRSESGFYGRSVISAIPADKLKITIFRTGENDTPEQEIKKQAETRLGLDVKKDTVNVLSAGTVRHGKTVKDELIMLAVEDQTITDHINLLEQAGLKPASIDTIPSALFRSLSRSLRRSEDVRKTMVFVDIGRLYTTVVFACNGEISFVKQVPIGGEKLDEEISGKLAVDLGQASVLRSTFRSQNSKPGNKRNNNFDILENSTNEAIKDAVSTVAGELAKEISLCLRYHSVAFRGREIERAVFTGGEAYNEIFLEVFKDQVASDVEVGYPFRGIEFDNVNLSSDRRSSLCEWAVAVGLALK
jgi:type IV pilus assembly protein PilM